MDLAPWVTIARRAQPCPSSVLLEHIMEIRVKLTVPCVQKTIIVLEDRQILLNVRVGITAPMGKSVSLFYQSYKLLNHKIFVQRQFLTQHLFVGSRKFQWPQEVLNCELLTYRNSSSEVFLGKGVLKICNKFTREHQCRSCFATLLKSPFGMCVLL